jgi:hypothetical protein
MRLYLFYCYTVGNDGNGIEIVFDCFILTGVLCLFALFSLVLGRSISVSIL